MIMTFEPNTHYITPDWPAPASIKTYSVLRTSGVSQSPRTQLDQDRLAQLLDLPEKPTWIHQVHSTRAVDASTHPAQEQADAIFTNLANTVCAVVTADCLPVMVCSKDGKKVAAIHAGWKGLAHGILEETLTQLAIPPTDTLVWLAPAIGPVQFEVRNDVYDAFVRDDANAASAFVQFADNHWRADLYALARLRLHKLGIQSIYGGEYCTHSDPKHFFSYRRDGLTTGRNVTLIWRADS